MAQPTLTPREFAQKWGDNVTKESRWNTLRARRVLDWFARPSS